MNETLGWGLTVLGKYGTHISLTKSFNLNDSPDSNT